MSDRPEIAWGKYYGTKKSEDDFYIKPDYDQWLELDYWDITEAVYLLNNWHPRADDYKRDEDGNALPLAQFAHYIIYGLNQFAGYI